MPARTDKLRLLGDVDITTTPPTDGQALVFDDSSDLWVPGAGGGGGGGGGGAGTFCDVFGDDVETTIDVEHNLGTSCVQVGVVEVASGDALVHGTDYTWLILDDDTVRLVFSSAPDTDDARVVVLASGGGNGGGGLWVPIATEVTASNGDAVTLQNLDLDIYRLLRLTVSCNYVTGAVAAVAVRCNNDSASNYRQNSMSTTSTTTDTAVSEARIQRFTGATPNIPHLHHLSETLIAKPATTTRGILTTRSGYGPLSGATSSIAETVTHTWQNTTQLITRLDVFARAGTIAAGMLVTLEGIPNP